MTCRFQYPLSIKEEQGVFIVFMCLRVSVSVFVVGEVTPMEMKWNGQRGKEGKRGWHPFSRSYTQLHSHDPHRPTPVSHHHHNNSNNNSNTIKAKKQQDCCWCCLWCPVDLPTVLYSHSVKEREEKGQKRCYAVACSCSCQVCFL